METLIMEMGLPAQARDGAASDEAILEAQRAQKLSPAEAAHLRQANAEAVERVSQRAARIRRVATAGERLDPSDPEDRAAVSAYWDSIAEVYASEDPAGQQEAELGFVARTGVLPQALERKYRGALLSRDAAVVVQGATAIGRLASLDPALVQDMPAEEVRRARAIATYAALGVEPGIAVEHGERKAAAESAQTAGPTRPGETHVAAADEPPTRSDATDAGALDDTTAGLTEPMDSAGIQPDGSAVLFDSETGEQTTIGRESFERVKNLAEGQAALTAVRDRFLETYDAFKAGEISREEAADALQPILDASATPRCGKSWRA